MQPIKQLLETWTQLVIQRHLTRKNRIPARFWRANKAEHGVRWWIDFEGVIGVVVGAVGVVTADVVVPAEDCDVPRVDLVGVAILLLRMDLVMCRQQL
jgi:hypothetical protein